MGTSYVVVRLGNTYNEKEQTNKNVYMKKSNTETQITTNETNEKGNLVFTNIYIYIYNLVQP